MHSGLYSAWHIYFVLFNMRHPVIILHFFSGTRPSTMLTMPRSRQSSVTSSQENLLDRVDHSRSKNSTLTRKNSGIPMFTSPPKTADGKIFGLFTYCFLDFVWEIIFSFLLQQKFIVFDSAAVWFIRKYPEFAPTFTLNAEIIIDLFFHVPIFQLN